jgi:peroxiredoxin Q/BCP
MPLLNPLLKPGTPAPAFRLLDQHGRSIGLDDFSGKQLVLLFFASDWLPGDLRLLKTYAEAYPHFQEAGIGVLGLSAINWESLHHLGHRLQIPFSLLFDVSCRASKPYQAMWLPKFITGRAVYVINSNGEISLAAQDVAPAVVLGTSESELAGL